MPFEFLDPYLGKDWMAAVLGSPYLWMAAVTAGVIAVLWIALLVLRAVLRRRHQTDVSYHKTVLLVTVPKESAEKGDSGQREKTLQEIQEDIAVMEGVFSALGGLKAERGFSAWLYGREDSISFEIVANQGLVSFYVAVSKKLQAFVEQQIQAQYHLAQIEEVSDYNLFLPDGASVGVELTGKRQVFFPFKNFRKSDSDPLNAVTNALAKVDKGEGAAVQFVVRSARASWRSAGLHLVREMQKGKSMKEAMSGESFMGTVGSMVGGSAKKDEPKKEYRMSPVEEETMKAVDEKCAKFGLDVNLRIVAAAKTREKATRYLDNLVGAFNQYSLPGYGNSLTRFASGKRVIDGFIYRHFSEGRRLVMTGEELTSMYHLPLASTETPNIRWLMARNAPPPQNIPKEGFFLGTSKFRNRATPININQEDRFRHMYIIGKSGSGKSQFIANLAIQDVKDGKGICIIDPHGDLVDLVLSCVPKERADDVIVFDPADMERPMALNMIESPSEEMKDFVCNEMIAIFYKLFGAEMIGPMFEHQMRNFMLTLMADKENPGTIAEIPRLISDPVFQKGLVAKVKDPVVSSFWNNEMARTSDFHKSEMLGYLISKVGRFVENTMMRNIIGQQRSAFDFREIMDTGKIFLVKLSKGKIGDMNANLLGLIIVTKLQMAVMGRADTPESQRRDFFLYIDEFQNFITPSIATILSEARKYRISLIIAHQYMGQLAPKGDTEIRDAVLGNVGTMCVGRIGIEDAEILSKEFQPVFTPYDLINVEKFAYSTKMLIGGQSSRPFTFTPPPPAKGNQRLAAALFQLSRLKFGRDRSIVEEEILIRSQLNLPPVPPPAAK
jgi:hypothetical protein